MDYRPDEVAEFLWWSDFEGFCLRDQSGLHAGPEGRREVGAGRGAAFLALVLEGAADGINCCVVRIGAGVD